jgi:CO/xanthine dehydrogenase FAD-binding subunit
MRRPQPFEIFQPTPLSEASAIMKAKAPDGHFLAGGTDLTIAIKEKGLVPRFVVDLKRIPGLSGIQEDTGGGLSIGSLTTLNEVETSFYRQTGKILISFYRLIHDG